MGEFILSEHLEEELISLLGDDFKEIKEFYYNACTISSYDYKIFLTRRSYVLYRIFLSIFKKEDSNFKVYGEIYNTHSLCKLINSDNIFEDTKVLIIDDIIINGRTVKKVFDALSKSKKFSKVNIWCIVCNSEGKLLNSIRDNLSHVRYVYGSEWKKLSNKLTEFIIASNIGYVSFVDTYYVNGDILNIASKKIQNYLLYDNSNKLFEKFNISSKIIFYKFPQKTNEKYGLNTCIRLYERNSYVTIIPYVFLPSILKDDVFMYCSKLLGEFNIQIPEDLLFKNSEKMIYQWTIQQISNQLYVSFLTELLGYRLSCEESYKNSNHIENYMWKKSKYTSEAIQECKQIFKKSIYNSAISQNNSIDIKNILNKYLTDMHVEDEARADNNEDRNIGIRVDDVVDIIEKELIKINFEEIFVAIIGSWDTGMSSYVVEETTNDSEIFIDSFIRNGEQTYRSYFEINSLPYAIFSQYFLKTGEYSKQSLYKLSEYLDSNLKTNKYRAFVDGLSSQAYLDALQSIKPETFGDSYYDANKCLNEYLKSV